MYNTPEEAVKDFKFYFHAIKGYKAVPSKSVDPDTGKLKYNYFAISDNLVEQDYLDHLKKENGLTPSPIFDTDNVAGVQ